MAKNNFFVTGASGQLGSAFLRTFALKGISASSISHKEGDIRDIDQMRAAIKKFQPSVLINCAAYNDVDKAEKEPEAAFSINSDAVKNLATFCQENKIFFIHYSTDYVFDGCKKDLYDERDVPNPLSQYGRSKLAGEKAVQDILSEYLLFRVSWVFGPGGVNFLSKATQWAKDQKELCIADDEISSPTYVKDIVEGTLLALEKGARGLYHLTNSGFCSRYEWVKFFFQIKGFNNKIVPASSAEFKTLAKRPAFSAMDSAKLKSMIQKNIPTWQDSVERFVKTVKA